ncbi:MAG: ATP-binding cassette domain-containing protein, partial [Poseidonia sp.]
MMFELRNGTVRLGAWTVFEGLSLTVEDGEIVSILGPSGCGTTTLL